MANIHNDGCHNACMTYCSFSCGMGCEGICSYGCYNSCTGNCGIACTGQCDGACKGACGGNCTSSCTTYCSQNCAFTCAEDCYGTCKVGCSGTCTAACYDSCTNLCDRIEVAQAQSHLELLTNMGFYREWSPIISAIDLYSLELCAKLELDRRKMRQEELDPNGDYSKFNFDEKEIIDPRAKDTLHLIPFSIGDKSGYKILELIDKKLYQAFGEEYETWLKDSGLFSKDYLGRDRIVIIVAEGEDAGKIIVPEYDNNGRLTESYLDQIKNGKYKIMLPHAEASITRANFISNLMKKDLIT